MRRGAGRRRRRRPGRHAAARPAARRQRGGGRVAGHHVRAPGAAAGCWAWLLGRPRAAGAVKRAGALELLSCPCSCPCTHMHGNHTLHGATHHHTPHTPPLAHAGDPQAGAQDPGGRAEQLPPPLGGAPLGGGHLRRAARHLPHGRRRRLLRHLRGARACLSAPACLCGPPRRRPLRRPLPPPPPSPHLPSPPHTPHHHLTHRRAAPPRRRTTARASPPTPPPSCAPPAR